MATALGQRRESRRTEPAAPPTERGPSAAEYNMALVHLYRAEVTKTNTWRQRLDTTTNWAVVTSGAAISFALGDKDVQRHIVILLTSLMVTLFMCLEARRYRHYDIWQTRVHLLESHFFAPLLRPLAAESDGEWKRLLAADLRMPTYHIGFAEALGWRLRRNYVWLYAILLLTWLAKISLHPDPVNGFPEFVGRAAIGPVPGWLVLGLGVLFHAVLIAIAFVTRGLQTTRGEVITPKHTRDKMERTAGRRAPAEEPA